MNTISCCSNETFICMTNLFYQYSKFFLCVFDNHLRHDPWSRLIPAISHRWINKNDDDFLHFEMSRDPIILYLCETSRLRNHDKTKYYFNILRRDDFWTDHSIENHFIMQTYFHRYDILIKYMIFENRNRWSKNFSESSSKKLCRSCPLWSFSVKINSDFISCDYLDVLSKIFWIQKYDEALWGKHLSPLNSLMHALSSILVFFMKVKSLSR